MSDVPAEWEEALGGEAVAGGQCMPIVSRTSNGPSLFAFDPDDINVAASPIFAVPLMYFAGDHLDDFGAYNGNTALWGGADCISDVILFPGTRTALFMGRKGMGPYCYGASCNDPEDSQSGNHAAPYGYQYWWFDMLDFAAVKLGTMQPYEPRPYAYGTFTFPITDPAKTFIFGMAYDPTNNLLYVGQARVDPAESPRQFPVVWVYSVDTTP
jgi:hypothetical protein